MLRSAEKRTKLLLLSFKQIYEDINVGLAMPRGLCCKRYLEQISNFLVFPMTGEEEFTCDSHEIHLLYPPDELKNFSTSLI